MLGETDRNHPPWPGTIVTMCVSYFMTGGPTKEHGTIFFFLELLIISYHQPEKLRKGQKEMPCVLLPSRILLLEIYLVWAMCVPPGRTLESETTCKLNQFSRSVMSDPLDSSMPGFPVYHQLVKLAQTQVQRVSDAIQPFHSLLSPSHPAFNLPQHQGLFHWVSSSHQVAKVLEFQLQHQSFQWIFRTDFL